MPGWACGARCSNIRTNSVRGRGDDTIFATSTGAPPAAIAIVRVSGPAAFAVAAALAGRLPPVRQARVRGLHDPRSGTLLDRALLLLFDAPRTATGEDVVEFHVHGGRAVVTAVEAAISTYPGVRRAQPGEFTRRALENGVIDLTGAEGLGDLLLAETETQRRAALRMAEGGLRALIDAWTTRLVAIAARIEAQLDFSDEDDVPQEASSIFDAIAALTKEVEDLLRQPSVERLHEGVRVVIAGPPNSGKSTLLNALAGRDIAIVAPISGTTRDRIDAPVMREGIAYVLTDTAGLTDTPGDEIEAIGISRAEAAITGADIVLWLGDDAPAASAAVVRLHARVDLPGRGMAPPHAELSISATTHDGLPELWTLIASRATRLVPAEDTIATNQRQRALLGRCVEHLRALDRASDTLIVAEEVRRALQALDAVTGRSGIENVLDALFSRFCIGK